MPEVLSVLGEKFEPQPFHGRMCRHNRATKHESAALKFRQIRLRPKSGLEIRDEAKVLSHNNRVDFETAIISRRNLNWP